MSKARAGLARTQLQASDAPERYFSITEAAAVLGVSRVSIWRWIGAGKLPVARLGHRTTRIKREELERLLLPVGPGVGVSQRSGSDRRVRARLNGSAAPRAQAGETGDGDHFVQFYDRDEYLLEAVQAFIGDALRERGTAVVVATPSHRASLDQRLTAAGHDVAALRSSGNYVSLDAADTLSRFMHGDLPDPERFTEVIGRVISSAIQAGTPVRAFGEMVALLAEEGNPAGALRLEELWNGLQRSHPFSLLCAYPMERLAGEALAELVHGIGLAHGRVIPAESYTALPGVDDRLRAIAALQQKAQSLQAEIAERKRAEERLRVVLAAERAAREQAEEALRLRDEFLSIASHELKTPLSALSGHAQLMLRKLAREDGVDPARMVEGLETISGQANKLSRLLGQLLDISRLKGGKLELELEPTDLSPVVRQAVASARLRTEGHSISCDVADSVEILADAIRLEQVLNNLLDNAIKYSPDGGAIEVTLARVEPDAAYLSVRDHGIGIPSETREHIFERFYQAHGNGFRSGMGLGLYISRQIVELHGGEICAEFPPGGGTCFVVRLPLTNTARNDGDPALAPRPASVPAL